MIIRNREKKKPRVPWQGPLAPLKYPKASLLMTKKRDWIKRTRIGLPFNKFGIPT